jgi:hypothetical protein
MREGVIDLRFVRGLRGLGAQIYLSPLSGGLRYSFLSFVQTIIPGRLNTRYLHY